MAASPGAHRDVAVGQQRVRGRARREVDDALAVKPGAPVGRAAQPLAVVTDHGHAGITVERAGVPAQVGELERVVDRAQRPVALVDRDPDAEVAGGARGNRRGGVGGGGLGGRLDGSRAGGRGGQDGGCGGY
jgi:hypothetical protein